MAGVEVLLLLWDVAVLMVAVAPSKHICTGKNWRVTSAPDKGVATRTRPWFLLGLPKQGQSDPRLVRKS